MGLGLYLSGRPTRSAAISGRELSLKLAEAICATIDDPVLRALAAIHDTENDVEIYLHPSAENVELLEGPENTVICSAKTSTCGPGYHAWLVERLERAASITSLEWSTIGEGIGDEIGYWSHRSFDLLQHEMAAWLHQIAGIVNQNRDYENLRINMPLGFPALAEETGYFVVTPIGPFSRERFELAAESLENSLQLASRFFPWWGHGHDGDFWRGLGLTLAWSTLTWSSPKDESQRATYELVLTSLNRARDLGSVGLPNDEMAEIGALLNDSDEPVSPPDEFPQRIGYRRRPLRRPLTGEWMASVPGYFYDDEEDDGNTVVYWFNDRTVRGSSLTVSRRDGKIAPPLEMVGSIKVPRDPAAEIFDQRNSDPPRWAVIERRSNEDGEYWMLSGHIGAINELCLCTICYSDEGDRDWAIKTWQSVSHQSTTESSAS
jgi:hypothetical protein